MALQHKQKLRADDRAVTSVTVLLIHLFWYVFGPVVLFVSLYGVVNAGAGWVKTPDIVFFVVVALMITARWLDQKSGQGTTSEGEPSTWNDFRRYSLTLPVYAVAAWIAAKLIGHFFM